MPFSCFLVGDSRDDDIDIVVVVIGLLLIAENEARYGGIVIVVSWEGVVIVVEEEVELVTVTELGELLSCVERAWWLRLNTCLVLGCCWCTLLSKDLPLNKNTFQHN